MRCIIYGGGGGAGGESGDGAYSFCRDDDVSSCVIYGGVTDYASFSHLPVG